MNAKRYAVIDIGTLKVKFQIVEKTSSSDLTTIYQSNNLTCLGCKMTENNNRPLDKNLEKTIDELKNCKRLLAKYEVTKVRAVSTHALREMGVVGQEICQLIKKKVGLEIEIISQQEEAELFFKAVLKDFQSTEDYVIVDVGGGSVQILIGNVKRLKESFLLKTGTSTLWDKFTPKHSEIDFPKRTEIRKMRDYILQELQPIPEGLKAPIIYGSSCIIDVFKGVRLPLSAHELSVTHPYKANVSDMANFLREVWPIPYDAREEKYISPTYRYMWGVDKAFLNIVELAKKTKAPYVIPSNANINQGLLMSIVE